MAQVGSRSQIAACVCLAALLLWSATQCTLGEVAAPEDGRAGALSEKNRTAPATTHPSPSRPAPAGAIREEVRRAPPTPLPSFVERIERLCALSARIAALAQDDDCLLYTSPSPRDTERSRMPSSA